MMSFLNCLVTSRILLPTLSYKDFANPRQQTTIYDGKVTVQPCFMGRQTTYSARTTRKYTPVQVVATRGNNDCIVTIAKGRVILPSSALSQEERDENMIQDLSYIQTLSDSPSPTMLLIKLMIWNAYDSIMHELNSAKIAHHGQYSQNGSMYSLSHETDITSDSKYHSLFHRVRLSTSASGSQPSGNTKNDRILVQTPSSNSRIKISEQDNSIMVKSWRSKDEAPAFIINFLKVIQVRLKETVCRIRTDNGTEFVNQTLREYYEKVGISHETSVARSQQ
ncbi:retrovirus-related pol polyprotein from transposon TNT 1-94 [Tanacetum coccineum]